VYNSYSIALHADKVDEVALPAYELQCVNVSNLICVVVVARCNTYARLNVSECLQMIWSSPDLLQSRCNVVIPTVNIRLRAVQHIGQIRNRNRIVSKRPDIGPVDPDIRYFPNKQ